MAKIEGEQNIPAEWLDAYRAALTEKTPDGVCRKRYPYRLPRMQEGGAGVSEKQEKQRERFKQTIQKFKQLSREERERWYESRPPWRSLLWYYNYFMLSGLAGNAIVGNKGGGVIKSIKHYTFTMPAGSPANVTVTISAIDPQKAIAFFYGAGFKEINVNEVYYGVPVYPYLVSLNASQAIVKASLDNTQSAGCGISIIEYI